MTLPPASQQDVSLSTLLIDPRAFDKDGNGIYEYRLLADVLDVAKKYTVPRYSYDAQQRSYNENFVRCPQLRPEDQVPISGTAMNLNSITNRNSN